MVRQGLVVLVLLGLVAPVSSFAAYSAPAISAEDVAHSAGETLQRNGCRRIDSAASSAGASGDWATMDCDENGRALVAPAVANEAAPTDVEAKSVPLSVNLGGALRTTEETLHACEILGVAVDNSDSYCITSLEKINGVAILAGAGATGTGSQRVTEANDSQLSAGVGATGDAAATAGSTGSITAKLRLMTTQLDTMSTALASALTALQLIDNDQTGGSFKHYISAGSTEDEHEIKATAGRLFSINVTNTNASARYLRCANLTAANTTPGTSTVIYGMAIPGAGGFTASFGPKGMAFSTALTCWLVTGAAETDVAEVAANEINVNYTYE